MCSHIVPTFYHMVELQPLFLQEACSRSEYWRLVDAQGRPPGLIGMWPSRAITFIENHDTVRSFCCRQAFYSLPRCITTDSTGLQGSTLNHWPFPWNHLHEGYAYILTHPGTPCVFYDHFWQQHGQLGNSIQQLLRIRKKCGIHSRSKVVIRRATADCYAALIDDKLAMKMGHGDYSPNHDVTSNGSFRWELVVSGPKFAVWAAPGYATTE